MRLRPGAAAVCFLFVTSSGAEAADCGREAFSAVVSQASTELAALNEAQKNGFQQKLQLLKSRQSWTDADFVEKATPFVKDDRIAEYDAGNKALLARVPQLGVSAPALAGATASLPGGADRNCTMLKELRSLMTELVGNSRAKWAYMLGKVDKALEEARQAKAGN
jgi:hypothetical protein